MKTKLIITLMLVALCGMAQASAIYSFDVFTDDSAYCNDPGLSLWAEVYNGDGTATFKFHNSSTFNCSIARIFFDDGSLLGISSLVNGPGTEFDTAYPGPGNLPSGNNLTPPFSADREFNIGAEAPPSARGINPEEWVCVTFDLINGGTLQDVLNELASGALRVGIHVISFPDGKSESAIMIPEPATALSLVLGGLLIAGYRRFFGRV